MTDISENLNKIASLDRELLTENENVKTFKPIYLENYSYEFQVFH
jgi:hypothetical protein